ncbi:MAG: SAM-dependent methyltransferase [Clostridia bacterium]|nr:SAM-dependent methyltransferase [Clostridia bacterium]
MMKNFTLDTRLDCAAKFVRQGARFADIGTDHAYLPIFLLKSGKISYAVCSDINEGPLNSARENARDAGIFESIEFTLADGADALCGKGLTDIAICGMGGELIAGIVEKAELFKNKDIQLILQPMSKFAHLRRALAVGGFEIRGEAYSSSQGKLYVTFSVFYTGTARDIDEFEAEFGNEVFLKEPSDVQIEFLRRRADALLRAAKGKAEGGIESCEEQRLFDYVNNILRSRL